MFLWAYQLQHWDTDIFWALKSGEWIVANMDVPRLDPFSYTFPDKEWIDFTWGFQVVAHIFYTKLGGWTGLFLLQIILTYATFYLLYKNFALLTSKRLWFALALIFLVYANARVRYIVRPQLFAYFFMALYFYILTLFMRAEGRRNIWLLALLLPVHILWVNFHSSFILGIFIVGAYAAGEFIEERIRAGIFSRPSTRTILLIVVTLLLPLVSLINPYGYKLAFFPLIHMGGENSDALRYIGEWTPTRVRELLLYFYPYPLNHFATKIIFYGTVAGFILNFRKLRVRDFILIIPIAHMATSHVRWLVVFALFAAPIFASNISSFLDSSHSRERLWSRLSIAVAAIFAILFVYEHAFVFERSNLGLGLKEGYFPEETVKFMKENRLKGNIFNTYIFGGYLIYEYPEVKVFIDGRTPTVYSPYHFWTSRLVNDEKRWTRLVRDHNLDMALIGVKQRICPKFIKNKEWIPVNFDNASVLFLKDVEANSEAIARWGLKYVDPCDTGKRYELPTEMEKLVLMRAELKEYDYDWGDTSRPYWLMGLINMEIGEEENLVEAIADLNRAMDINYDVRIHYDQGLTLIKLGRYEEALGAFEEIINFDKSFDKAYYGLGLAHYYNSEFEGAYESLKRYIDIAGDGSEELAYKLAGLSAFNIKKYDKAAIYLKRAAFLTEEPKVLANIYYFLANSFLEEGALELSSRYYQLAITLEPEYRDVIGALARDFEARGKNKSSTHLFDQISLSNDKK